MQDDMNLHWFTPVASSFARFARIEAYILALTRGFYARKIKTKGLALNPSTMLGINSVKGFTLIELLVVVAVIAILAVMVAIVINPGETVKKSRDAKRVQDLSNLRSSIDITLSSTQKGPEEIFLGSTGRSTDANAQNADGTGWIKLDLSKQLGSLPIDLIQKDDPAYAYEFKQENGRYEIRVRLESQEKQQQLAGQDGGDDPEYFELGSILTLL